jgi:hypothetical protein
MNSASGDADAQHFRTKPHDIPTRPRTAWHYTFLQGLATGSGSADADE